MYYDLTKSEKKVARACIDKGLFAEYREALQNMATVIQHWKNGKFESDKIAYHTMMKTARDKDRAIARRYDGLSGSHWLEAVASIYRDGYITDEDVEKFHEETKATIKRWAHKQ